MMNRLDYFDSHSRAVRHPVYLFIWNRMLKYQWKIDYELEFRVVFMTARGMN